MDKKDIIALADYIRGFKGSPHAFTPEQIEGLAMFCRGQNSAFKKERWLAYIAGECGPSGGKVKKQH